MIQVQAKDPNGVAKWIQLDRAGVDKGHISIVGLGGGEPEISYDLIDIRSASKTEFLCKADGPVWFDPPVSCRIVPGGTANTFLVQVNAGHLFKGSFAISAADCSALMHFMNTPPFPKA
ncbi:hypothetical protein [Xanthobacter sp.]|uniref:hypothetical protein n=1 Tax=Xanthobacter sp. TaxID=35809 RepID=UPI0025DD6C60|nr:hypothetical protein [Xanthobacter sp.]